MFKFDNSHIFTGYLKQLLSSFNLPACRVYTNEFAKYLEIHGKEDPRVIESFDTISYKTDKNVKQRISTQVNYLKGSELYSYFWNFSQDNKELGHKNSYWKRVSTIFYDKDKNIPGLTKVLKSPGNSYDTITHEYLGDYLRFMRDYYNLNLMSLYNCFNNKICSNLYYRLSDSASKSSIVFDSQDDRYRIYAFPIKLFQDYTIAIDCEKGIELFCGLYDTTLDTSEKGVALITKTYKKLNRTFFKQPFLFDKLNVKYWNFDLESTIESNGYPKLLNSANITRWDIANKERDLKLFIKIPSSCRSSITVLEGDFRSFNDHKYEPVKHNEKFVWEYKQNHSVINFADNNELNDIGFVPIGKLQLLAMNTGESYPFANRLVEYLCNSAITSNDEIADNIKRAQKVMNQNHHYFKIDGIWENKMQKIIYDYMMNAGPIETIRVNDQIQLVDKRRGNHPRLGHTSKSALYDVLGYIDKDAEKWYASWIEEDGKATVRDSIQNVDIYNGLYDL